MCNNLEEKQGVDTGSDMVRGLLVQVAGQQLVCILGS